MTRTLQLAVALSALAIAGAVWFVAWRMARTLQSVDEAAQSIRASADGLPDVVSRMNETLDTINAPCIGYHGSVTCGPLAQLSQTEKNIGIVAGQSALQVRQTGELIRATSQTVQEVSNHLTRTADAATDSAQALTGMLGEGKRTLAASQPVLDAYAQSGRDLDALIQENRPVLHANLQHSDELLAAFGATATDFHVWSHPFLNPPPCSGFRCTFRRTIWPVTKTVLGLGSDIGGIRTAFGVPIAVTVK